MKMSEKYDAAFLAILQNEGNLPDFLESLFSFLLRKTDFYCPLSEKMGFPPGAAYNLLTQAYKKYESLANERLSKMANSQMAGGGQQQSKPQVLDLEDECPVVAEEVVSSSSPAARGTEPVQQSQAGSGGSEQQAAPQADPDSDSQLTRQQQEFQSSAESYNGAIRDRYSWSQSINDVDIVVKVPEYVRRGGDVRVDIGRKELQVAYRADKGGDWLTLMSGPLTWPVDKQQSMWSLEAGKSISINLEKIEERWWEAVLHDEPRISVRKIDASRPMTDLDDEAQAKIGEMMFNEHQKKLGQPQSHELKVQEMLKKAWDAEGSPFKDQPFDPSLVKVSSDGMPNT